MSNPINRDQKTAKPVLTFVTDCADQAVIMPLVGAVALTLSWQRRWRVLLGWIGAVGAVLATILFLKVACYTCAWIVMDPGSRYTDLRSPSGHTASAGVAFAGIATLLVGRCRAGLVWTSLVAAVVATLVIGATRIELGAHSVAEVGLAAVVGIVGALAFVGLAGQQIRARPGWPVLAAAAVVITVMHGSHLPAEAAIQHSGVAMVRRLVPACDPNRDRPGMQTTELSSTTQSLAAMAGIPR